MANPQHLDLLKAGEVTWNSWREEHPEIQPDLCEARLADANLMDTNLINADLSGADLRDANFFDANLTGANLNKAYLAGAYLVGADLTSAKLVNADLRGADLSSANLTGADLTDANLVYASLVHTNLTRANLTGCLVYGTSVWDVWLDQAIQLNLIITPTEQPIITVDNLKTAQFIYLLLNNREVRDIINTITSKVVLILGRFTPERKSVLDALRDEIRKRDYLPILFDFEKPRNRNFTETVRTLAHLARFILADITDPSSIPQELQAIVPTLKVPVRPLLQETKREYSMFVDFRDYPWVLPTYFYEDKDTLLHSLGDVIAPAEQTARDYERERQQEKFE
jgi:hypothetical protein